MAAAGTESDQKRQRIYAACESCRKKKSKCLGGQPCKACISSARSALASSSKRPLESDPEVIAKAQELCIIDLNRKQRGPKAKSEKKTIESSSEVKKEVENEKRSKEVKRRKLNDEEASHSVGPSSTKSKEVSSAAHSSNEHGRSPSAKDFNSQFQDPYSFSSFKWPVHSQDQQSPAASHSSSELRTPSLTSASSLARNSSFDEIGSHTFTHNARAENFPSQDSQFPTPSSTSSLSPPASHARHALHSLMTSRSTSQFNDKNLSPFPPNLHSPQLPPPPSLSNVGRFNFSNPSFSWPQTQSTLAPQQNPSNQSDQATRGGRRESVSTELLRKLSQFYTDQDRPYIALALGQFSEFDAATKLIPSRCLFGEENNPTALADAPAHLQLALLSLLAHRSLLLPESQSSRDLKSAWAEEAPPKLTRNSPLSGEMRENMLLFGRRSWNLSHNLLLSALSEGVVEPSLLQTGYILDMSASEDGIGTKTMGQFKAWLFHIVKAWHLNLIDSHPSFPIDLTSSPSTLSSFSSSPSSSPNVRHLHVPPQSSPEPRKADARYLVTDPIDREALRRVIFVICSSYSWTHSNDHNQPTSFHLGIQHFQVNSPSSDDEIHIGSRWKAERTWKENNLLSLVQRSQRLWNRANLLLHTPLEDLLLNRGPEIDLQNAIQQLEDESEEINHLVTVPKIGQDPAIKIQAFLESRLAKLILNRLFSTLSLYSDLRFALPTTVQSKGNLRASEHLVPQGQANASIFETLSGVSPTEGPVRKLIEDGADPNSFLHFYTNTLPPQSSYRLDPVRPSFSKNPRIEALQSVIEIGWLVTAGYEKLEAAHQEEEPLEGEVGTAAGLSISSDCRALRWPRHLRLFSQHAFAMSSEVRVAGWSWIGLSNAASAPNNQQLASIRNYRNENHLPNFDIYQSSVDLWETGEKLIRLLKALGKSGSAHSNQTAALAEKYRDERARWIESQLGNQANR